MSYRFYVCVDPEEGHENHNATSWAVNEQQRDNAIQSIQQRYPLSTICVYELKSLQKLVSTPKYAQYKTNEHGEILPV